MVLKSTLEYTFYMAATININDMQRDLMHYLSRVKAGETLIITQAGQPVAEVKPVAAESGTLKEHLRPFELCKGEFVVPDDFDAPLPEELLSRFES